MLQLSCVYSRVAYEKAYIRYLSVVPLSRTLATANTQSNNRMIWTTQPPDIRLKPFA